jgi:hypothetical protein
MVAQEFGGSRMMREANDTDKTMTCSEECGQDDWRKLSASKTPAR